MQTPAKLAALVLAITPLSAAAQEFTGGTLGVQTFVFTDDFDIGTTAYFGSAEVAVWNGLSLGANASYYGLSALNSDARNLTLHGIYDLGGVTAGAFYALDGSDVGTDAIYGLQGALDFGKGTAALYAGALDGDSGAGQLFGADASFAITNRITGTGSVAFSRIEDIDQARFGLGGAYALTDGLELFGDISRLSRGDDVSTDSQVAIGLGARLVLGPDRGTTFGSRSIFEVAPGF